MGFGLDHYIGLMREKLFGEQKAFKEFKDNWDWYNVWGSLFGFDYFLSPNPMTRQDKMNFTESLPEIIVSNFEVLYNSLGMILVPKRNLEYAVAEV